MMGDYTINPWIRIGSKKAVGPKVRFSDAHGSYPLDTDRTLQKAVIRAMQDYQGRLAYREVDPAQSLTYRIKGIRVDIQQKCRPLWGDVC